MAGNFNLNLIRKKISILWKRLVLMEIRIGDVYFWYMAFRDICHIFSKDWLLLSGRVGLPLPLSTHQVLRPQIHHLPHPHHLPYSFSDELALSPVGIFGAPPVFIFLRSSVFPSGIPKSGGGNGVFFSGREMLSIFREERYIYFVSWVSDRLFPDLPGGAEARCWKSRSPANGVSGMDSRCFAVGGWFSADIKLLPPPISISPKEISYCVILNCAEVDLVFSLFGYAS